MKSLKTEITPAGNEAEAKEVTEKVKNLASDFLHQLILWEKGNKTAGQRARVILTYLANNKAVFNKSMLLIDKKS
jgi:hypothetical protein